MRFTELLAEAKCESGDAYANALADLVEAERLGALSIERDRRSGDTQRVRVPMTCEAAIFARIGRASPTCERQAWAALFSEAVTWSVPERFADAWRMFCARRAEGSLAGRGWKPFRRTHRKLAGIQLRLLPDLLAWKHPTPLRTVSARIAGSQHGRDPSKFLGDCRGTFCSLLAEASGGEVKSFADLGISDNPRSVVFSGPVRARIGGTWTDYAAHTSTALNEDDLVGTEITCAAPRCVTVENETKFHELCRLRTGDVFVFTSYPNRATLEFLRRLPVEIPRFHFGDTDPWGFDVLRSLRASLAPAVIVPLHMVFRPNPNAKPLTDRDAKKLGDLLGEPLVADVRGDLEAMRAAGNKGDYVQESVLVSGAFPYVSTSHSEP